MATQFPSTVAGAILVRISPASIPSTGAYMPERGTAPAVIPPLVMGIPINRIPSRKEFPIAIPRIPAVATPAARATAAVGSSFTVARRSRSLSMLNRLPVISADM